MFGFQHVWWITSCSIYFDSNLDKRARGILLRLGRAHGSCTPPTLISIYFYAPSLFSVLHLFFLTGLILRIASPYFHDPSGLLVEGRVLAGGYTNFVLEKVYASRTVVFVFSLFCFHERTFCIL